MKITNNTSKKLSLINKIFINPYGEKEIKEVSEELKEQLKTLEKNKIIKIH
jgi:hypothetical protein